MCIVSCMTQHMTTLTSLVLEDSWTYKLTVLADRIARQSGAIAARVGGLNLSQWRVLAAVADQDGRTASQVVDMTPMDKGIVSRAVAWLVAQNYLQRVASTRDGRISHLYLTERGRNMFEAIFTEMRHTGANGENLMTRVEDSIFLNQLDRLIDDFPAPFKS